MNSLASLNPKKLVIPNADITSSGVSHVVTSCVESLVLNNCYRIRDGLIVGFAKGLGTRLKGLFIVTDRAGTESQISDVR